MGRRETNLAQSLSDLFPALGEIGRQSWQSRIPFVSAATAQEQGAACLSMVLGFHGKSVPVEDLREALESLDGAEARDLILVARKYGLMAAMTKVAADELEFGSTASLLRWKDQRWVVFERIDGDDVLIVDPFAGPHRISRAELQTVFDGAMLQFEPSNDFVEGKPDDWRLVRHLRAALTERGLWSRLLVTAVLLQVLNLALPILTGAVVSLIIPRGDWSLLFVVSSGMGLTVLLFAATNLVRAHLLARYQIRFDMRMLRALIDHIMGLPFSFFQNRAQAELFFTLRSTIAIREAATSAVLTSLWDGLFSVLYLLILFVLSAPMGLLVLAFALLQLTTFVLAIPKQHRLAREELDAETANNRFTNELLLGIETVKAQGMEVRNLQEWSQKFVAFENLALNSGALVASLESLGSFFRIAGPLFVLMIGTSEVMSGKLDLGTMLALNAMAVGFVLPFSSLLSTASNLQKLAPRIQRIEELFRTKSEQDLANVRLPALVKGMILLEGVSFRYGPSAPVVVRKVSLEIGAGKFVAICGASGSGKSTLAKLIAGLYSPTEGRVLHDDSDLAELDHRLVRQHIGYVAQKPTFMLESIARNIGNGEAGIPLEAIHAAARSACIHEEIIRLPMGYDTILVNEGNFSGGQLQRMALARALVRKPKLLILDEATSALDAVTERAVHEQLDKLGCTRVVIAHRMSTIQAADRIVVMEAGSIVDSGVHQELLTRSLPYRKLLGLT